MKGKKSDKKQEPADKPEIDNLNDCNKQLETYINDLKRLQADFENYKKRVEKENIEFKEYCNKEILFNLLTLMDDFEHTLKGSSNATKEDLDKSLDMLYSKLKSLLEHYHVKSFTSLNEKFNPFKHEVLLQQESDNENLVLEELQKGYFYKDKILRHAKVKISKLIQKNGGPNNENQTQ